MSENISVNNIYQTQIPSLTDAANIKDAFKLYHFGSTTEPASASVSAGIAKHLYDLQTLKAAIAGPTFTGTLTAPTINASTALQIGGVAITSSAAELNILDGVTSSAAELNILDGVTSTAAELNILDGVTATAAELNLIDNSVAGTVVNSKAVIYGAAGQVNATTLQIAGTSVLAAATPLTGTYGGTGVNNGAKTITLGGNLTLSGAFNATLMVTALTSVFLPTTGTLVARDSTDTFTNKSISGSTNTFTNIPNSATTATNLNTASAIVTRDASGNFTAGTITAALSGNATTATGATNINVSTIDGNSFDTAMYPVLVAASSTGNQLPHIDSTGLAYNASTNTLSAFTMAATSAFVGDLTGTADNATRAALYVTTGTDTGFDYRRIFVGPTAPDNTTHTLQIGDVWIDT